MVASLRTVRNSDQEGDLRETHEGHEDPAVGIRKPGRPMGGTRARLPYESHTRTGTGPTSTDGQSGEGSDGRSGIRGSQA